jgi:hypothetical protein
MGVTEIRLDLRPSFQRKLESILTSPLLALVGI